MKVQVASVIALACCLQISCASTNDSTTRAGAPAAASQAEAARPRDEGVYLTGSRLPVREPDASATIQPVEPFSAPPMGTAPPSVKLNRRRRD
jgi:hypothetical protein